MKKGKRMVALTAMICVGLMLFCTTAGALSWNGTSAGGGGKGSAAKVNGYAVRTTGDNCLGYRFSAVDSSGANLTSKVIDVFRNTAYGVSEYSNSYKFDQKYNKKQIINNQNGSFSTSENTVNCYLESKLNFASVLPTPERMESWQANNANINRILSLLGVGSISNLHYGDKILVEPLYDVKLEKIYHSVTTTELAVYGKYILGADSNGGANYDAGTWGFIASYTNKHYPNSLFTTDGMGLWNDAIELSTWEIFYNIINKGYGVGIAYTEKRAAFEPNLTVNYMDVVKQNRIAGEPDYSLYYGYTNGDRFGNWTYQNGYPQAGDSVSFSVCFHYESQPIYVRQNVRHGGNWISRDVEMRSNTVSSFWMGVQFDGKEGGGSQQTVCVEDGSSFYYLEARQDWIDRDGEVLKYGAVKGFYVPIKPTVYRYQVSAVNCSGEVQAYNGSGGSNGKVYVGQKVYAKYMYTAKNTWISSNNLYADMYNWNGADWVRVTGTKTADLDVPETSLSSAISQNLTGSLGFVRVPDNSCSGSNVMRFKMTTQWAADPDHTGESTWIDIPIVKSDVELYDMYLVDEDGYIVDQSNLEVGQVVTVYYEYKNNTDTKIFVNGFNDDESQIPGVFAIPANGTITVAGSSYTVPNEQSFDIWGGVYLEDAGIRNTDWETDGANNCRTLSCKSKHPVSIVPIAPNAGYRENTEVISSFRIYNASSDSYIPSDNLQVRFTVSETEGTQICTETKPVVVKANDNNLVYFKWKVPTGLNGANVVVKVEILDGGTAYNPRSNNRSTTPYTYYTTPDTQYEEKAPTGFSVPAAPTKSQNYATWTEYVYENGDFVAKNYGIGIPASATAKLIPAEGSSAVKNASGSWTMKSGYGVWLEADDLLLNISGYLSPASNAYTSTQYACALYPEYGYQFGANKCTTLYLNDYQWCFNKLNYTKTNKAYHYTPLYFPDGQYIVKVVKSDMWTPSGMIQSIDTTKPITISGNAYDDWYIGRK